MLSFLNFNARQLASTNGFSRKVNKVASILGIRRLLYSEIINIEESSIDVLLVDEKMYFYKVHLYSLEATKMLNDEFNRFLGSLGYTINDSVKIEKLPDDCNLIEEINSLLSKAIELLNVENSFNLDKLENTVSSEFNISIKNFSYAEIYSAVKPLVKSFITHLFNFKIIGISDTSVQILAITRDCRLFQYTIPFNSSYTKFINRYLSAILPYEKFVEMKRNLRNFNFTNALKETVPSYKSTEEKFDVCSFLAFLLDEYKADIKDEGAGVEGLKNLYKFFIDTSSDEDEAKNKVRSSYNDAKTYEEKFGN